jgi:signal transduction histidine kinase
VAGVAHELNTPIGNALMVATTLGDRRRELADGLRQGLRRSLLESFLTDAEEAGEVLVRNLARAAELIASFKQLSADQSSYQRREFALGETVRGVLLALSPMLRRAEVSVTQEVDESLVLDSYPGPLQQVIENLLTNTVAHAFEGRAGGRVHVQATEVGGSAERIRIVVSDDGKGMAEAVRRRAFDPFFTTRMGRGGSGLGLHICYTLVTGLLGGRIDVESRPGEGCRFVIELPRVAPGGQTLPGAL